MDNQPSTVLCNALASSMVEFVHDVVFNHPMANITYENEGYQLMVRVDRKMEYLDPRRVNSRKIASWIAEWSNSEASMAKCPASYHPYRTPYIRHGGGVLDLVLEETQNNNTWASHAYRSLEMDPFWSALQIVNRLAKRHLGGWLQSSLHTVRVMGHGKHRAIWSLRNPCRTVYRIPSFSWMSGPGEEGEEVTQDVIQWHRKTLRMYLYDIGGEQRHYGVQGVSLTEQPQVMSFEGIINDFLHRLHQYEIVQSPVVRYQMLRGMEYRLAEPGAQNPQQKSSFVVTIEFTKLRYRKTVGHIRDLITLALCMPWESFSGRSTKDIDFVLHPRVNIRSAGSVFPVDLYTRDGVVGDPPRFPVDDGMLELVYERVKHDPLQKRVSINTDLHWVLNDLYPEEAKRHNHSM